MIRAKKVMVSMQAGYDEYHAKQARLWEAYYAGREVSLGPDMEVAEGPTMAVGDERVLAELALGPRPTAEQITALGAGLHPVTGDRLVALRPGADRVAYNDFVYGAPKSISVEYAAARAAGDDQRCAELIADFDASVRAALHRFAELLPLARRGDGGAEPMSARPITLLNIHSAARPVKGQEALDPHLHAHMRVLNIAKGADGKWSAVDYRVLYHNARVLKGLIEAEGRSRRAHRGERRGRSCTVRLVSD